LDPEQTLVIINSKSFTTAETILNARTVKQWLVQYYQGSLGMNCADFSVVKAHMCAASTNLPKTREFGIADEKVFGFWDWVGGRFSVTSVVGVLPLSLVFGNEYVREFLDGAHEMDQHFRNTKDVRKNIPLMMGLIGFYNSTIQGISNMVNKL
jgi:glucose-6-phosphate isomerase